VRFKLCMRSSFELTHSSDRRCFVTCLDDACETCIRQCSTCHIGDYSCALLIKRAYVKAHQISLVDAAACCVRCEHPRLSHFLLSPSSIFPSTVLYASAGFFEHLS
jgi:hypothetical protein